MWKRASDFDFSRPPESYEKYIGHLDEPPGTISRWIEALTVRPLSANEWKCLNGWWVGPRTLKESMWYLFPDSRGIFEIDKEVFEFKPNSLLIIPADTRHKVKLTSGRSKIHYGIHFFATIYSSINFLSLMGFPYYVPYMRNEQYIEATREIVREFALKPPGWRRSISVKITEVLIWIIRNHGHLFNKQDNRKLDLKLTKLNPVLESINQNLFDREMSVKKLAHDCYMSEVHLRKLFRTVTGTSPSKFINQRRVDEACIMLKESDMAIKEIALATGFVDLPYFYRVFGKIMGQSPKAFRNALVR